VVVCVAQDDMRESINLRNEQWRHVGNAMIKAAYRGTIVKSSETDGLLVHFDGCARLDLT
jgi:hypothetical protein